MTEPSLLLVGGGRLTENGYLPALAIMTGIRLGCVVDPDRARRRHIEQVAADAGLGPIRTAATTRAALDGGNIDLAVVASPVDSHVPHATALSAAGVATLVEKPPASDSRGASELHALDPAPWIGFNRRFDPGAAAVRDAVAAVGRGYELRLGIHYLRRSWGAVGADDDALLDLGPHLVDWALWLTGGSVRSVACTRLDHERASLELVVDGGRVVIDAATDRPWRELIELRGAAGHVIARHRLGGPVAGVAGRLRPSSRPSPLVHGLNRQLVALARVATGRPADPRLATTCDGCAVMRILDTARTSAARGGTPLTPHTEI